jgi:cell wall-associated NlpC family hydrolase
VSRDRRRQPSTLGAHPERRVLVAARRAVLRGAAAPLPPRLRAARRFVVLPPVVNMYARPSSAAAVVSQATLGMRVHMLRRRGHWALAETPDCYRGWIRAAALRHERRTAPLVEVASLFANVYSERDVTARAPIAVLPMLARLELAGDAVPRSSARGGAGAGRGRPRAAGSDWLRVRLPDGRLGWVQRGDLRPADMEGTVPGPAALVATALRLVGLPYLWGGTTPFGLDCSGLVQLTHRVHGFLLPRDADQQFADRRLEPVPRRGVRAGDLVFFGPGKRSITHVGLALGPGAFVNATTQRVPVVRVDRLDDPSWRRLYRGARRLPRGAGD